MPKALGLLLPLEFPQAFPKENAWNSCCWKCQFISIVTPTSKNRSLCSQTQKFVSLLHVIKEVPRGTHSKQLDLGTDPHRMK